MLNDPRSPVSVVVLSMLSTAALPEVEDPMSASPLMSDDDMPSLRLAVSCDDLLLLRATLGLISVSGELVILMQCEYLIHDNEI